MGLLDRLLGREPRDRGYGAGPYAQPGSPRQGGSLGTSSGRSADDVAIDRYRYLLRTAPPDAVEQAHAEAFAQLTPEQRRQVLAELGATVPPNERAASDDPQSLARMATRAEMRSPGTLEQTFRGQGGPGPSFGSMVGSSLLGTVAGVVIGSAVANMMFGPAFGDPSQDYVGDAGAGAEGGDAGSDGGDAGYDGGGDPGAGNDAGASGGGDLGGGGFDGGGFGGDFGGGDFGGGGDF